MPLGVDLAIAKTNKYASRESGDTAEIIERPGGGFSVVTVDGQGSGAAAKGLSLLLTGKVLALLKEGVRDGAAARAAHDHLFAFRHGRVSAALDILSVDLRTRTVVVTRNTAVPMLVGNDGEYDLIPSASGPIGLYHLTRPTVAQLPMTPGLRILLVTDGVTGSGDRAGLGTLDLAAVARVSFTPNCGAAALADCLLAEAIRRDHDRPHDDMTVVALALVDHAETTTLVRRSSAYIPLP